MADAERRAFEAALANDFNKAVDIIREAINNNILEDDNATGWYLQRVLTIYMRLTQVKHLRSSAQHMKRINP